MLNIKSRQLWIRMFSENIFAIAIQMQMQMHINVIIYNTSLLKTSANYCTSRTKVYDTLDDFTFLIINFPFTFHYIISSNIPSTSAYISQLIWYSRDCIQYSDFQDRAQLMTQNLLKQGYVDPRLKSLLHNFSGFHQELVDHYNISI